MWKKRIAQFVFIMSLVTSVLGQSQVLDRVIAVVGDKIVMESDIEKQVVQYRQQGMFGTNIKCEIVEDMLYQKLLLNQAELDSVEVGQGEVDAELERRIQYFINQLGSEEKLEEFYDKSILELKKEFEPLIANQIKSQRVQSQITQDVDVTPTDVREFYEGISKDSLPLVNAKLQLQQITKYPYVSEVDILSVKQRLQDFKDRIEKGERFATLAALYSEDAGTAARGGQLGYVGRGDLVPEFAAVAFKLQKGQVSRIVQSEYGYHIIQLIDRRGEKIDCRHILLKPKVKIEEKIRASKILDSLRTALLNDTLEWSQAAMLYSDDEDSRKNNGLLINFQDGSSEFEKSQINPAISSAINKLNALDISKPFETVDQNNKTVFKIVRIKSLKPAHSANLIDDYQILQELASREKKEEFIEKWIDKKRKSTYIRIVDEYKDCKFKYKWIK